MLKHCKECSTAANMVKELLQLVERGEAPTVLHTLTDTLAVDKNLHEEDRCAVASLMHVLTTGLQEQIEDRKQAAG